MQLEQEWEKVKLQTNWKIEPCLINASEDFLEQVQENLTLTYVTYILWRVYALNL